MHLKSNDLDSHALDVDITSKDILSNARQQKHSRTKT